MKNKHMLAGLMVCVMAGVAYGQGVSSAAMMPIVKPKVTFQNKTGRDPMLSADDLLLLQARERQRLALEAAERRKREAEERKRRAEEERKRQWELLLLKDPTVVVRNKIKISGVIDQEVLIDGKLYTIGNTYMGAKIVSVGSDTVTFLYKGRKFTKKIPL